MKLSPEQLADIRDYWINQHYSTEEKITNYNAVIKNLLGHITALEAEKAELVKGINSAMDYANGRQCEWGERAIRCFEILDELLSKQEQE